VIERNDIVALLRKAQEPFGASWGVVNDHVMARQGFLEKTGQPFIVIDV
jgi:hypothetical protein